MNNNLPGACGEHNYSNMAELHVGQAPCGRATGQLQALGHADLG